jgi:prevent-host-death family protein
MKTIGSFEAKTRLSDLLKRTARGESFLITKRGKPVASLSPVNAAPKSGPMDGVMEYRRRFAKSLKKTSVAEIIEWKNEGRM